MEAIKEKSQEVLNFLKIDEYPDGDGYGYGDGSGFGDDDGYGYGDGDGSGYGSGFGDGYGSGDGSGYGSGFGDGSGYGSGYGYGDGSGYGYGENIEAFRGQPVHIIDGIQTLIDKVHGNYAVGRILNSDFTTEHCYIAKYSNYFAHGDTLEDAIRDAHSKYEENMSIEERIKLFNEQFPDRDKKVPAKELFIWHHTLTGSCPAGRKHFCKEHGLDYENGEYTVNEFIQLTKDAYNGSIIRQLEESRP